MDTHLIKRSVDINQKLKSSTFIKINVEVLGAPNKLLGASPRAEKWFLSRTELYNTLLPEIIGVGVKNESVFYDRVVKYFRTILIEIPAHGKKLDTSIIYNIDDTTKTDNIKSLVKSAKDLKNVSIKTSEDLAKYCEEFILEEEKFKFASFTNKSDYVLYLYACQHNRVASTNEAIEKTGTIDFYLSTEKDVLVAQEKAFKVRKEVRRLLTHLEEKDDLRKAILININVYDTDTYTQSLKLEQYANENANMFIELCKDTNVKLKGDIKLLVRAGFLINPINSGLYVDANKPELVLGSSIDETVSYLSSANNEAYYSALMSQLKSLK